MKTERDTLGLELERAASFGDLASCEMLIKRGVDVNWTAPGGISALHRVAQSEDVAIAKLLIESGADVNQADRVGARALTWAAMHSAKDDLIRVLLEAGAEPNFATGKGRVPLCIALERRRMSAVRLLVQHGADPSFVPEFAPPECLSAFQHALLWELVDEAQFFAAHCRIDLEQLSGRGKTLAQLAGGNEALEELLASLRMAVAIDDAIDPAGFDDGRTVCRKSLGGPI